MNKAYFRPAINQAYSIKIKSAMFLSFDLAFRPAKIQIGSIA